MRLNAKTATQAQSYVPSELVMRVQAAITAKTPRDPEADVYIETYPRGYPKFIVNLAQEVLRRERITYAEFWPYLAISGLTLREIYLDAGIDLSWHQSKADAMHTLLAPLQGDETLINDLITVTDALIPDIFTQYDVLFCSPSARIKAYYKEHYTKQERMRLQKVLQETDAVFANVFRMENWAKSIPWTLIPVTCEVIGLPLHWCLGQPDEQTFCCQTPYEEHLLDTYMLLPERDQQLFGYLVSALASTGMAQLSQPKGVHNGLY